VESWISKDSLEDVRACLACPLVVRVDDRGSEVYVECKAVDRFDCPLLLRRFYPRLSALPEGRRRELVAKARAGTLTPEESGLFR